MNSHAKLGDDLGFEDGLLAQTFHDHHLTELLSGVFLERHGCFLAIDDENDGVIPTIATLSLRFLCVGYVPLFDSCVTKENAKHDEGTDGIKCVYRYALPFRIEAGEL